MGGRGVEDEILSPLLIASSLSVSEFPAKLLPYLHQGDRSSWKGFGSYSQGDDRASSPLSGILQPSFSCAKDLGVVEARDRSVSFEQVCSPNSLQDGVQPVVSQLHSERQLDILLQLEGCISSSPGSSRVRQSTVPLLCGGQDSLSVSSDLFQPLHGLQVFTRVMAPVFCDASRHGRPDTPESGLTDPSLLQVRGSVGEGPGSVPFQSPQHCHQHSEDLSSANTDCTYLGMVIMSPSLRAFPSPEKVSTLLMQITKFLSYRWQNVSWRCLLGRLGRRQPRRLPSNVVPAVAAQGSLGFCG